MRTLYIILFVSLAFFSCEERRDLDVIDFEKKVVLNAIISTDSTWHLNLSYTKSIFDTGEFEMISDASVHVLNKTNGQSFFLDEKRNGRYCRQLNPTEGHEYELKIEIEDRPLIKASTYVPSVLNVDVISQAIIDTDGLPSIEIDIEIEDNPNEENFYVWELKPYVTNSDNVTEGNSEIEIPEIHTLEASVPDSLVLTPIRTEISKDNIFSLVTNDKYTDTSDSRTKSFNSPSFISDKESKEGKIINRLVLDNEVLNDLNAESIEIEQEDNNNAEDRVPIFQLSVKAVSGELYKYLQTYEAYKTEATNTSIVAPTNIYSNIDNGSGIFGGYSLKTFNIY